MKAYYSKPLAGFLNYVLERPSRLPHTEEPTELGSIFGRTVVSLAGAGVTAAVVMWLVKSLT